MRSRKLCETQPVSVQHSGTRLFKMAQIEVKFTFHSGISRRLFSNVRLSGSWNAAGQFSNQWTVVPMAFAPDTTGCDAFTASASFDASQTGVVFEWGVLADMQGAPNAWVIATEVPDENSGQSTEASHCRRITIGRITGSPQDANSARRNTSRPHPRTPVFNSRCGLPMPNA